VESLPNAWASEAITKLTQAVMPAAKTKPASKKDFIPKKRPATKKKLAPKKKPVQKK